MVRGTSRHPLVLRIGRRTLRDGPRHQHTVDLQSKVVVIGARNVMLDDKPRRSGTTSPVLWGGRLGTAARPALGPVLLKRHLDGVPAGHRLKRLFTAPAQGYTGVRQPAVEVVLMPGKPRPRRLGIRHAGASLPAHRRFAGCEVGPWWWANATAPAYGSGDGWPPVSAIGMSAEVGRKEPRQHRRGALRVSPLRFARSFPPRCRKPNSTRCSPLRCDLGLLLILSKAL